MLCGEFPRPPELLKGKGVTDDPPGETYWKVANGIRLTGMPGGYSQSLSPTEMWKITDWGRETPSKRSFRHGGVGRARRRAESLKESLKERCTCPGG